MKRYLLYFLFLLCLVSLSAQTFERFDVDFIINDKTLANPLAGGLNCPQLSAVDLNNDGRLDLHIFDRVGNVQLTFLNDGMSYQFSPTFTSYFPIIQNWMLLRDYNGDGIMDIFAYSDVPGVDGIMVFKGKIENNHIAFERVTFNSWIFNILSIPTSGNARTQLFVSKIDFPAVDDIDCDGDLDILTFNIGGGYVEFYANQSVERGFGRDTLIFEIEDRCWGGFYESGLNVAVDLAPSPNVCFQNVQGEVRPRHAGSTLLTFDGDNDGDKELILGDLSFNNLNFLHNAGTCTDAWMNSQDPLFPAYDVSLDLPLFPAAFYLDLNNDGVKDLAVAPNSTMLSEDLDVVWWYQNIGSNAEPNFELQQKNFLVDEMLDFGSGAAPTFLDYNADGLMDLVVGTYGQFKELGSRNSRLLLFANVGTKTLPKFELVDNDFLNMSVFNQNTYNFSPTFGDLDGDGDLDVLVGEEQGRLFYAENTAGADNPVVFGTWQYGFANVDVGIASTPQIIDLNQDGLPDLVIGERNGNLNYFQNIGTASAPQFNADPSLAPNTERLGMVDARTPGLVAGYSAPYFVDFGSNATLLLGTNVGQIERYSDLEANIYGTFVNETETLGNIREGAQAKLAAYDLDDDGFLEMVVGNLRGGLSILKTDLLAPFVSSAHEVQPLANINIFPNPTTDQLTITSDGAGGTTKQLRIFSLTGQLMLQRTWSNTHFTLNVAQLPEGIYIADIESAGQRISKKLVIMR